MKLRTKMAFLALSTGLIALQSAGCLFRWLGDALGDTLWLRNID